MQNLYQGLSPTTVSPYVEEGPLGPLMHRDPDTAATSASPAVIPLPGSRWDLHCSGPGVVWLAILSLDIY